MPENRGYYDKYNVTRKDGKEVPADTHWFCIDVTHDPLAETAIRAYVTAGMGQFPELADVLTDLGWEPAGWAANREVPDGRE